MLLFSVVTLGLLAAAVLESRSVLVGSLDQAAAHDAAREARLTANLGLAAALTSGRLSERDLRLADNEYGVARRDSPLMGIVIWTQYGIGVFSSGLGQGGADPGAEPSLARLARRTDTTQMKDVAGPAGGEAVEVAVPLGSHGWNAVADFYYSEAGVERDVDNATKQLYVAGAIAAVIMYLAILPLLARLVSRLPPRVDPSRRAALAELKEAIVRGELVLHYQPKLEVATGTVVGVEGLVRWQHPTRGLLAPAAFLALAESSQELLAALTATVLDIAGRDCAAWLRSGRHLPVAINVPAPVLLDASLASIVRDTLERHQVPPAMLTLELTEGALMEQSAAAIAEALRDIRALGVSLSIDDFGTGYSSLARLRALALDELKIDRSFISGIAADELDLGITRLVVDFGVKLGLRVVAEGVEDAETLRILRALGCPVFQGFYASRALPSDQLCEWFAASGASFRVC